MEDLTLVVEVSPVTVHWPEGLDRHPLREETFERRLAHYARHSSRSGEPVHYEHISWVHEKPMLTPVVMQPIAAGRALARVGEARAFDPAVAFGPLALEFLRSINQVVLLTETDPSVFPGPRILFANRAFEEMTGYCADEVIGKTPRILQGPDTDPEICRLMGEHIARWEYVHAELVNYRKDGSPFLVELDITPVRDATGWFTFWCSIERDITHQRRAETERHHQMKLESIGQLAAGIAHEINTPVQYVNDNVTFLTDVFPPLLEAARALETLTRAGAATADSAAIQQARHLVDALEIEFVAEHVPRALAQSLDGLRRVTEIVRAMKGFSHPSQSEKSEADLNELVETTLTVSRNEWKYVADMRTELDSTLPPLLCHRDELGQVVLNLVVNAAHAIASSQPEEEKGTITVRTWREGDTAFLSVTDDGPGIPEEIRGRIFDPFFTTKEVGKGTGQGLAIARSVVVDNHAGAIQLHTEVGAGTTFVVALPMRSS